MPNDAPSLVRAEQAKSQLRRVADALGVPVEAFFGQMPFRSDAADAAELLRLWNAIADLNDRQALLATARNLAARHTRKRAAAE